MNKLYSKTAFIWGLILISLILLLIFLNVRRSQFNKNFLNDRFDLIVKSIKNKQYGLNRRNRLQLPLNFDKSLGLYKTEITISNGIQTKKFNVIADTGSNKLLIPGSSCNSCNISNGVWDINSEDIIRSNNNFNIGSGLYESNLNRIKKIRYGGGQVSTYIEEVGFIVGFDPNDQIIFGVIIHSDSPNGKSESVMGLQPDSDGFLSSLEIDKKIKFDFKNKRLLIGDIPIPKEPLYRANNISYPGSTDKIKFIVVGINGIRINGWSVPNNIVPKYGIIDIGTTNTIVNQQLYDFINSKRRNINPEDSNDIPFGNINHIGMTLEGSSQKEIRFNRNPLNYLIVDHLPNHKTILLGNQWLNQYSLMIDLDNNYIYFE